MSRYPEYAHLGFKTLCCIYGYFSIQYMVGTYEQRNQMIELMKFDKDFKLRQSKLT